MKQKTFRFKNMNTEFGGERRRGIRKRSRPLVKKNPVHLVLKSSRYFYADRELVLNVAYGMAKKFHVAILDQAVAHDHVHFVIRIPAREYYVRFIRALTGILARKLGKGLRKQIPYTRIATWGREFRALIMYLFQNREEAAGRRPYKPRNKAPPK